MKNILWFLYTKYSDVITFSYAGMCFLLQGRKNKITGATHFRIEKIGGALLYNQATANITQEQLNNVNLWEGDSQMTKGEKEKARERELIVSEIKASTNHLPNASCGYLKEKKDDAK